MKKDIKVAKMQIREENTHGRRAVAMETAERLTCGEHRTHGSVVSKGRQQQLVRHW